MSKDERGAEKTAIVLRNEETQVERKFATKPQDRTSYETQNLECPYLSTIDRKALDFDFEKVCSVSLSKVNVYACLVCGRYFTGRKQNTHAFTHSISESHHVFLNLETHKFYCLPDNYEIKHQSLNDILHVLKPTFTQNDIDNLDESDKMVTAHDGSTYYPGIVGLNNLKFNDYCNVIFQALGHVLPLRDHFLLHSTSGQNPNRIDERYLLSHRFGELMRKLWNPKNFKSHVSPHEMLQAIVLTSGKRFEFTKQSDPIIFLSWFLDLLLGPKRVRSNIIEETLQVVVRVNESSANLEEKEFSDSSFYLTLDLPSMPLFPRKDERGRVIKPRVNIYDLLKKYDGQTKHEFRSCNESTIKRYSITRLPKYLILHYKRLTKNTFFTEKNTHIVDFPLDHLDLTHLTRGSDSNDDKTPKEIVDLEAQKQFTYKLVANIVHDGEPDAGKGTFRIHILHRPTGKWFEMQDLYVTEMGDTMLITLSEPYIQVWQLEKQENANNGNVAGVI